MKIQAQQVKQILPANTQVCVRVLVCACVLDTLTWKIAAKHVLGV